MLETGFAIEHYIVNMKNNKRLYKRLTLVYVCVCVNTNAHITL